MKRILQTVRVHKHRLMGGMERSEEIVIVNVASYLYIEPTPTSMVIKNNDICMWHCYLPFGLYYLTGAFPTFYMRCDHFHLTSEDTEAQRGGLAHPSHAGQKGS